MYLFTPHPWAHPKIVLEYMHNIYIYIFVYTQFLGTCSIGIGDALVTGIQAPAGHIILTHEYCNTNKLYKVSDAACIS